ncbi:hypothetical protein K7X08_027413 [Anisodus acutangulus]|uniref:Glycosyltransferase N-terminal domain-containing protein n=1 Tax=Anisodus acutangulus TaxID=402998 RepID=A0A9Q1RI77_9SOLA|nr:hypothetical protein K7X08_027413 [Anisodus acutangulus]
MEEITNKSHVVVLPFPIQGHINPMVQFSKRLASRGAKVTIVIIESVCKSMPILDSASIKIESIPHDEFPPATDHLEWFRALMSNNLTQIVEKFSNSEYPVKVLVLDSATTWAIDLAHQLGLKGAAFFTQSRSFSAIYYHMDPETVGLQCLGEQQMEELTWGLMTSKFYFLWVIRATEENKLPKEFMSKAKEKGLIVNWFPQLDVLAHRAVECFFTHCGWNLTLEALSLGVPIIGMPQWTDQPTNAKFISDVWQTGIRDIREVMEEEKGVMQLNGNNWLRNH